MFVDWRVAELLLQQLFVGDLEENWTVLLRVVGHQGIYDIIETLLCVHGHTMNDFGDVIAWFLTLHVRDPILTVKFIDKYALLVSQFALFVVFTIFLVFIILILPGR